MKMFEHTSVATGKTHKTTTVLVSCVVQSILVIIGILIPMIYFDALPTAQLQSLLVAPPPPPPSPPPHETPLPDFEDPDDFEGAGYRPRSRRRNLRPHRGTLILVLGILSICLGCLGLIFGPMAWVMGNDDLHQMRERRMDPAGEGLTQAGRVCGIIGTLLHSLGCLCWGGILVRGIHL